MDPKETRIIERSPLDYWQPSDSRRPYREDLGIVLLQARSGKECSMVKRKGSVQVVNKYGTRFTREQMLGSDDNQTGQVAQRQSAGLNVMGLQHNIDPLAPDNEPASFSDSLISSAVPDDQWNAPAMKFVTTSTPWGQAQCSYNYGRGVTSYATSSHGGYIVAKGTAESMPEALREIGDRQKNGSYAFEEDLDWRAVAAAFPERFPQKHVELAVEGLKDYYPDQWEKFSGEKPELSESTVLRERKFWNDHEGSHVSITSSDNDNDTTTVTFAPVSNGGLGNATVDVVMSEDEYYARREDMNEATGGAVVKLVFTEQDEARVVSRVELKNDPASVETKEEAKLWLEENPTAERFDPRFYTVGKNHLMMVKTEDGLAGYVARPKKEGGPPTVEYDKLTDVLYDTDRDGPLMSRREVGHTYQVNVPHPTTGELKGR